MSLSSATLVGWQTDGTPTRAAVVVLANAIRNRDLNILDSRRHTYRFFSFPLAVLRRPTFAAARRPCVLPSSVKRAAAALVRRTPG
jgi:hypothetical protein